MYNLDEIKKYSKEEQLKLLLNPHFLDLINKNKYEFFHIFVYLIENNQEEFRELLLNDLSLLKIFVQGESLNYYKVKFPFDYLIKLIKTLEKNNIEYNELYLLVYYNLKTKDLQLKFLNSDVPSNLKKRLLNVFKKEVVISYIEKENIYLTDKEIYDLLKTGIEIPDKYYLNKRFFVSQLMDDNITIMNDNINIIYGLTGNSYFYDLKYKMFDNIILSYKDSRFNTNSSLENTFLTKYIKNHSSHDISKKILVNLIIDNLFEDNLRNVYLNLKELLSYNREVLQISEFNLEFYQNIINIYNLSIDEIINIYLKYKSFNIKEMFYDDLRHLKNISYKKILDSCLSLENNTNLLNEELSKKYKTDVYELKGEDFTCLISCLNEKQQDLYNFKRNCYSLINQNNMSVFIDGFLVFGYTNMSYNHIMHVFEQDAYSLSYVGSNDFVSRIRDKDFILNSPTPNEIQIINDLYDAFNNLYKRVKPSYIICFDLIDEKSLKTSIEMNLPILLINKKMYKVNEGKKYANQKKEEMYYTIDTINHRFINDIVSEDSVDNKNL